MSDKNKNTEFVAQPAADLFQVLVENAMDVITLLDESGAILYQNQSVERAFGYTQEELLGQQVLTLVHPEDIDSTSAKLGKLLQRESREERHELRFLHKNGEWRYIQVQARFFEDQSATRVVITSRDVTESHKVLDELQQSNERFQTAFHASANICSLSKFDNGEFIDVNLAWEKSTGWTREEAISSTALDLDIWGSPENRQFVMSRLLADGKLSQLPASVKARSGGFRDVLLDAKILMISGLKCVYLSALDITETKKLEEQLRQSQKIEAVGQLTGGIAHDFNNLLSVILGSAEIIEAELDQNSDLRPLIEAILKATDRGAGLTHQLLAFSRKQTLQPVSVSLNEAVNHTTSILSQSLSEDIEIQTRIDADLWPIRVDPGQLENALLNLALNSRDAMPGGGTLTIAYSNKTIPQGDALSIHLDPGDYVSLACTDTGIGIPLNAVQRVFEPFYTTKETGRGTGLGLSMVFGFVKQSGGHVSIQSEQNKGTTVTILLPRDESEQVAPSSLEQNATIVDWQGMTALLVEDNHEVRKLTARMLKLAGFEVLQAEDGRAVVELLKQHPTIDFLLSDVILPGELKGPEIAKLVHSHSPDVAILLMSGYTHGEIHPEDDDAPFIPIISKPFTNEALLRQIQTVFASKQ